MEDKYAFLMLDVQTPKFIEDLQNKIPESYLYRDLSNPDDYGIEFESHVTIYPCMDNDISVQKLISYLVPSKFCKLYATNISIFKNENYDVLKCDIDSHILTSMNYQLSELYKSYSEFTEYKPHLTIAYLKPGIGENYIKEFKSSIELIPECYRFSYYMNDKQHYLFFN